MDSAAHLAGLSRELDAFEACLDTDLDSHLDTPIEHCGDWTLYDLADHLGRGNLWAATAVTEKRSDRGAAPAPRNPAELRAWFRGTTEVLVTALRADPRTEAWTFFPPHTVGFWRRRRCLETLVHRWDAEHALGGPSPMEPRLAADGVAEVIDTMVPRLVGESRTVPPERAVRLAATDTGGTWVLGPGDPVATLSGTTQTLLLMLWGRVPRHTGAIEWEGDRDEGLRVLDRRLVP